MRCIAIASVITFALIGCSPSVLAKDPDKDESSGDVMRRQMSEIDRRVDAQNRENDASAERLRKLASGEDLPEMREDERALPPIERLDEVAVPPNADDLTVMTAMMTNYTNQVIAITNRYQSDLESLPISAVLAPESFSKEADYARSRTRMSQMNSAFDKMQADATMATRIYAERVRNHGFNASLVAGFNSSFREGEKIKMTLAAERSLLEHIGIMVERIIAERPQIEDGRFLFETDEGIREYNEGVSRLAELVDAQTELARLQQAETQKRIEEFNRAEQLQQTR